MASCSIDNCVNSANRSVQVGVGLDTTPTPTPEARNPLRHAKKYAVKTHGAGTDTVPVATTARGSPACCTTKVRHVFHGPISADGRRSARAFTPSTVACSHATITCASLVRAPQARSCFHLIQRGYDASMQRGRLHSRLQCALNVLEGARSHREWWRWQRMW